MANETVKAFAPRPLRLLQGLARQGFAPAMLALGSYYDTILLAPDAGHRDKRAHHWYDRAAEHGLVEALVSSVRAGFCGPVYTGALPVAITELSLVTAPDEATAAEINAAADGDTQYRLTGYIREVANDLYGNLYVTDFSGEVYVYGVLDENGESKQWANMGIDEGDIITVVGPKSSFKGDPQMVDVSVEDHKVVTEATLSEFIAAEKADDVWYRLTGTVNDIYNTTYGNFHLLDGEGNDVTVYGLVAGWGGPDKEFASLGIEEGDVVTIVGVRDEYNGTVQVGDAFFVSKAE